MSSTTVIDESHWKSLRLKHIGASEVAALFGLSPWLTRWQVYMLKTGRLPDVFENLSMTQGKHFEPAIASYAQEKFNIQLRKVRRYLTSDTIPGMGASLDYEEYGTGSLIPTELKWSLFGDGWEHEGEDLTAIPDAYMLQVQHQIACAGTPVGQIIAFVGSDLKHMVIPRNDRLVTAIESAVAEFWADVAAGKEPPVDFTVDAAAVTRLAYVSKLRTLVMTSDAAPLFETWKRESAAAKVAEIAAAAARAEILKRVVDAGEGNDEAVRVTCGEWRVSVSKVEENLGREITPAMIGERVGARKGYLYTRLSNTADKVEGKKK